MAKAWNWLSGKKTYILAVLGFVYAGGIQQGWWTDQPIIDGFLLSGTAASIRHSISTTAQQQEAVTIEESSKTP